MLFDKINLRKELEKVRNKEKSQEEILQEIHAFFENECSLEEEILKRIEDGDIIDHNPLIFDLLESDRIFHISHIKRICTNYRLRFLNTKFYKGELPREAITATRQLEREHDIRLKGFHIMAPAEYFRLEDADDPILFAPLGNNYFYLIHKWGKDLHPLRKMLKWPLRNLETLIVFSFFFSFFLTFGIRETFFSRFQETSEFIILFMYTFKSVIALIFFYGISLGKNFSSAIWNSKFYNA